MMFPTHVSFEDNELVVRIGYWTDGQLHLEFEEKGKDVTHTKRGLTLEELVKLWPEYELPQKPRS